MKKSPKLYITIALVVLFAITASVYMLWQKMAGEPAPEQGQQEGSTQETIEEGLAKPAIAPPATQEQKQEIRDALTKPPSQEQQSQVTDEERQAILDALNKPAE